MCGGEGACFGDGVVKARVGEPLVELDEGVGVEVGADEGADLELCSLRRLVRVRGGGAGREDEL